MKIKNLILKESFDSRGNSTLSIGLFSENGEFWATVPSGKSMGKNEAKVLSFQEAKTVLESLKNLFENCDFSSLKQLDQVIKNFDPSFQKEKVGGNLALAISLAGLKAIASESQKEIFGYLQSEYFPQVDISRSPEIYANLINGGQHAKNNLDFQEYLIIASTSQGMEMTIKTLINFYKLLGEKLFPKSIEQTLGDEGGYDLDFESNLTPIEILHGLIESQGLQDQFKMGLDTAANSFYKDGQYVLQNIPLSTDQLSSFYIDLIRQKPAVVSLEDPFSENDMVGFKNLLTKLPTLRIVGDDLTVTNPQLIDKYAREKLINGIIIKPNQIGTITETCEAINDAKKFNLYIIISHRSGETEESYIIDLAKACSADAVKIGAPIHERLIKYNRLIEIYP